MEILATISIGVVQTLCSDYLSSICLEVMLLKKKKNGGERMRFSGSLQLFCSADATISLS